MNSWQTKKKKHGNRKKAGSGKIRRNDESRTQRNVPLHVLNQGGLCFFGRNPEETAGWRQSQRHEYVCAGLCDHHRFDRTEHEFDCRDHRCHAHIAIDGNDSGDCLWYGDCRFQGCPQEPHRLPVPDGGQPDHIDDLLFADAFQDDHQRIACPHESFFHGCDCCHCGRHCGHHRPDQKRQIKQHHSRRCNCDGIDAAAMHMRILDCQRTSENAVGSVLPVCREYVFHLYVCVRDSDGAENSADPGSF